jgi:hypothetical protein
MTTETELRKRVGIDADEPWPAYAWPGGYPIVYVMNDGEVLCADCMNGQDESVHFGGESDDWQVIGADVFYEGADDNCAHCGQTIESAYGDPEESDTDASPADAIEEEE